MKQSGGKFEHWPDGYMQHLLFMRVFCYDVGADGVRDAVQGAEVM